MTRVPPPLRGEVVPIDAPAGVPGLIRRRYAADRDKVACADGTRALTLYELEMLSDAMAERLRRTAGEPGPVVLRLRRGVDRAVAVLGVLKAGCAYLPVDPDEPAARVASMVRQAQPVAVVGDAADIRGLPVLDVPSSVDTGGDPAPLDPAPPDRPVYVMFTSGSTGEPKGVVLGSAALCSRLLWMQRRYPLTSSDRVLQKTPYTFDPSGWELFLPLIAGGRCEFAPDGIHRDPARLAEIMIERRITVCHFVPSMLAEFLRVPGARAITSLRRVFCSGEALSAPLARRALDMWPAGLHNLYGPTEAAIDVTYWDVPSELRPSDPVPIGMPVDNTVLSVVDEEGNPVAAGTPGELWIGGSQLALGYAGRPDLSSAAFPVVSGERWYRTGDLVRETAAGLHYLGRIDEQVKIGGVRVEPLEVENVLGDLHTPVGVVAVPDAGGPVLVAALAGDAAGAAASDDELRRHAAARLPAALVPAAYHRLPSFPLGSTGKLDRRRLTELVRDWWERRTPVDDGDRLGAIWSRTLNIAGPADETAGFLSAGGSSLAAIRLIRALREATGVELTVGRFLNDDISLARLRAIVASSLAGSAASADPAARASAGARDASPLAPEQRRLWLLSRVYPDSPAYNVTALVRFTGTVSVPALRLALDAAARRHDILRAEVTTDADGTPSLRYEPDVTAELVVEETGEPLDTVIEGFAQRAATAVIGERHAPMLRARLLRSSAGRQSGLVLVFNHLVADQETVDIVLADLASGYAAALRGAPAPLTPAPSYADYAVTAAERGSGERWSVDIAYWRERLAGAPPELLLPFRLADRAERDFAGEAETLRMPAGFRHGLEAYLRNRNATTAGFFLAVFAFVLAAWSGQDTVVVGLPSSHRRSAAEPGLAGFLVDTLPVRLDLAGLRTFGELLRHARVRCAEAMDHSTPPFDAVVTAVQPPHRPRRDRVFQVWLNDLTGAAPIPQFPGLTVEPMLAPVHSSLFDLGLYLYRDGDGLTVQLVRALDAYPRQVARELLAQCAMVASRVLAEPDVPLADVDLVTDPAVLPRPDRPLPPAGPRTDLLDDIAGIVAGSPESVAVTSPGGDMTYRQLWERAGHAAAGLAASGARAGDPVAVFATREADLPVAVLACWLAGVGAALIDAALPEARRQACRQLLGSEITMTSAATVTGAVHSVSDLVRAGAGSVAVRRPTGSSHVLFTSGTTGTPLPVSVAHGPLRDFLRWYVDAFEFGPADRFALLAGPGHDPVLREMFGALLAGARLHMPPAGTATDVGRLLDWLAESRITVLHATPGLLELLVRVGHDGARLDQLRLVVVGGAPLTWGLVRRLRALTDAQIVNAYGTTETPQIVSCHRIAPGDGDGQPDAAQVPVGAGIAGQDLLVMTPQGRLAGVGQRGEVVVRGRNLALGYVGGHGPVNRFGDDPQPGVRTFRTGDVGRYGTDGLVMLGGRADRQVSVDGHRVELGEIEAVALRHPLVRQAVASLTAGAIGPMLTLHVTASGPLPDGDLRTFLRQQLPAHAVPAAVQVVGDFRLGPTGKVVLTDPVPADPAAPLTEGERALAAIEDTIRDVLGRSIGPDENFFDAGLTSLALVQLHEVSTGELSTALPVTAMFAYPNLRALRRYLSGSGAPGTAEVAPPTLTADPSRVRRIGSARRELRRRIRSESEQR